MYPFFSIVFNHETKEECITFYKLEKNNKTKEYQSVLANSIINPLGTFLFDFVNCDFSCQETFNKFISKYCFESLYFYTYAYQLINQNNTFCLTENEYTQLLQFFYNKYSDEFCMYSSILYDFINIKERLDFFNLTDDMPHIKLTPKDYGKQLNINLNDYLENITLDFNFKSFFNNNFKNIDYAYTTNNLYSLLFLCAWKLTKIDNIVYKCQNCGKYFIPDYKYDVKYCNYIFSDNKTCKELAPQLQYKKKLENEPVLKKYKTFYQTLQKNASLYGGKHIARYENFKKESHIMKKALNTGNISIEKFCKWIDSKKIRK